MDPRPQRFRMLALLTAAVLVNYLDRAILGIAAPAMRQEFHLSLAALGLVFSAFSWTYALAQIPAGALLDRMGTRTVYGLALVAWSGCTALHALAGGKIGLILCRCGLGLAESPCFPANNKVVTAWFPRSERALAIGIYTSAEYIGLGALTPLLFAISRVFGWRALFVLAGLAGLVVAAFWAAFYREPEQAASPPAPQSAPRSAPMFARIAALFAYRQMWGLCIGQFGVYATFVFFLTWFPTYLATDRHMGWITLGWVAALPYLAGFFGVLVAGAWSDAMVRRGVRLARARKLPVVCGLLGASSIVACAFVRSNPWVIAILSFAFFAQSMSSSGWAVLAEVAPPEALGLVGGLFGASALAAGIVMPILIGLIVAHTGSFGWALGLIGLIAAIGALAWVFLVPLSRMEILRAVPEK